MSESSRPTGESDAIVPAAAPRSVRLWPLAIATFVSWFGSAVVSGLLPSLSADLGVGIADAGILITVYGVCYAIMTPIIALLARRVPRRVLLIGALVLFGVFSLLTMLAQDLMTLSIVRVLCAVAAGGITPTATVMASQLAAPGQRGRALATVFGGLTTASVVAAPVGNLLGPVIGFSGIYVAVGAGALLTALAVHLLVPPVRKHFVEDSAASDGASAEPGGGVAWPMLVALLAVSFLETAGAFVVHSYAASMLAELSGASVGAISAILLCYGVAGVFGNIAGGRMSDRIGPTRTLVLCMSAATGIMLLLPFAGRVPVLAGALFAVWGFAAWAINTPVQGMLLRFAGDHAQLAVAVNSSVISLGTAAGASAGAIAIGMLGLPWLGLVSATISATVVLLAVVIGRIRAEDGHHL